VLRSRIGRSADGGDGGDGHDRAAAGGPPEWEAAGCGHFFLTSVQ
jgi:hypothetical protein